jgi:molybdate transport system regulatory protein
MSGRPQNRLKPMPRLSIRIYFEPGGGYIGRGMAQLLQGIQDRGSIRQAAAAMGMGYRKAWLLIQQMQETFGGPVVTTATGGLAGGGAILTDLGETILLNYRTVEVRAQEAGAPELQALSAMAAPGRTTRSIGRAPRKAAKRKRGATSR